MLENLLQQREELLEKIRRIAETCEGIENKENARRVTELNGRQAELLALKDELKNKLSALDGELGTIGKNIQDLSGSGLEKILQAIKNQRWFFFANKPKVLMDRDTALLWTDLNYFPWGNGYGFLSKANAQDWGGFNDWEVPTPFELWKMIEDKSFPFTEGGNWRIKGNYSWPVNYNGNISYKDLDDAGATSDIKSGGSNNLLPCSHAFVPTDYENNISPTNNFYSEKEKLQFTLNIFVQNDLIPLFNNAEITHLYRTIFVEKPALVKQLADLEAQIAELESNQVKLTANFNYRPILAKFDKPAIDKSVIKYSEAVIAVADELLDILREYEAAQAATIAEFLSISLKLATKTYIPKLTGNEYPLFAERQRFFVKRLELGFDKVEAQILSIKAQAERISERLDEINRGDDSIYELAKLQAEPRADFELLVENLARNILDTQRKVDFFVNHKDFVAKIVNTWAAWNENYKIFKTTLHDKLTAACRDDGIDEKISDEWYGDWQRKRFAIEQRFLPLIKFAFKGNLSNGLYDILGNLQGYRDAVNKFYLHERKNIYKKFAAQSDKDWQEELETASELYKLAEKFQRDLQGIIFSFSKTEERIFLLKWAEPLLNSPIDDVSNLIRDCKLYANSEEILNQFASLKRQNFATYLADSKAYAEAIQKHAKEFNALILKASKDLPR